MDHLIDSSGTSIPGGIALILVEQDVLVALDASRVRAREERTGHAVSGAAAEVRDVQV